MKNISINNIPIKLRSKLARSINKLGLSWTTYAALIDIGNQIGPYKIDTAAWYYNIKTKQERIIVNPRLIEDLKAEELALVLKHEMLHKAMLRNIDCAANQTFVNFALDAVINKILTITDPRHMLKLARYLFPIDHPDRTGVQSIMNCSITNAERDTMPRRMSDLYNSIYSYEINKNEWETSVVGLERGKIRNNTIPDPLILYYKMCVIFSEDQKEKIEKNYEYVKEPSKDKSKDESKENKSQGISEEPTGDDSGDNEDDTKPDTNGQGDASEEEEEEKEYEEGEEIDEENEDIEEDGNGALEEEEEEEEEDEQYAENPDEEEENSEPILDDQPIENSTTEIDDDDIQIRGGPENKRANDKTSINNEIQAVKNISNGGFCSHRGVREMFDKYIFDPRDVDTDDLQDFITNWHTMRQVEGIEDYIYSTIASTVKFDALPVDLTRTGLEYVALGVSGPDAIPFYYNNSGRETSKKKICCYFDVSPSMQEFLPYMIHVADFFGNLGECCLAGGDTEGKYKFAGGVKGIDDGEWMEFRQGKMRTGYSTSFEAVIKHAQEMINEEDCDIIVVFTDGESSLTNKLIEEFNDTNKKCYRIYFTKTSGKLVSCWGQEKNKEGEVVSALDKLNGDSFTITIYDQNRKK